MTTYLSLVTDLENTLVDAASATGDGPIFAVPNRPTEGLFSNFVWQVIPAGGFSGLSVTLQGSLDRTNWTVLDTNAVTTGGARAITAPPVFCVKANVGTYTPTDGTSVTVLLSVGGGT